MHGYSTLRIPDSVIAPDVQWAAMAITYAWLERFVAEHNRPPAIFEIALGRNISYAAARGQLELMQYRGWLRRDTPGRSIEFKGIRG
jgi:hypothetical protein